MKRRATSAPYPRAILTVALALVASLVACKPKTGQACKIETKEVCQDKASALACHDGKWEALVCKGPKGCAPVGGGDGDCDQSAADENDVCNLPDDHVCTADKKKMLACTKNHWMVVETCSGQAGCDRNGREVQCDNSIATAADPCTEENDAACAADGKSSLVCHAGKFEASTPCRGPKGCTVTPGVVHCDNTVAEIGDACHPAQGRDQYACSGDTKNVLKCVGQKFASYSACKKSQTCKVLPAGVDCTQ